MSGVIVKPLVWKESSGADSDDGYRVESTETIFGSVRISGWPDWGYRSIDLGEQKFANLDDAKSLAWTRHKARILSTIDTTALDTELSALRSQVSALTDERDRLREALTEARHWHDSHRDDLGKQPPSSDMDWRRMEHREEIERIDAALSPKPEGE